MGWECMDFFATTGGLPLKSYINIFMNINYNSCYKLYANTEVEFLTCESQELYNRNFINRYVELEKYGWITRKITYKFNSHGFRCDEFTEDPSVLFLGCSYTCGIGLPIETVWTSILAQSLGLKSVNLGQGGGSNDTAFRLGYHWIPKLKPKIVVLLSPLEFRKEIVTPDYIHFVTPQTTAIDEDPNNLKLHAIQWLSDDTNSYMNQIKNVSALELLCNKHNIKFIVNYNIYQEEIYQGDFARDLAHPGIETHKKFADYILNNHL
jgi:hypothetical protein